MKIKKTMKKIKKCFFSYGVAIKLKVAEVVGDGERVIFGAMLKPGTREQAFFNRAGDVQTALRLPLFHAFKEGLFLYLAVAKQAVTENSLMKIFENPLFRNSNAVLPLAVGYDVRGNPRVIDLVKLVHLLVAGSTGSGKTIALICLVLSLIVKQSVNKVNLILMDINANCFEAFRHIPHLSHPIIRSIDAGVHVILNLVKEMDRRYTLPSSEWKHLPRIVFVGDEYVSFIANISDSGIRNLVIAAITNILRNGRKVGMHIVLATQDPTKDSMKVDLGNVTARMAFACAKYHNSIAILGCKGAEQLPGKGAMLFKSPEHPDPVYLQGAYMEESEVKRIVDIVNARNHDFGNKFVIPELDASTPQTPQEAPVALEYIIPNEDRKLADIIMWTLGRETVAAQPIQQRFRMDKRANDFLDRMYQMGIVVKKFASQPRRVVPKCFEELSTETVELLNRNGYTDNQIREIFGESVSGDNDDDSEPTERDE